MATETERTRWSMALLLEQFAPMAFAVLSVFVLWYFADAIALKFSGSDWKSAGLYSAVFGWSAIQTGFAFGVYGFVIGKGDGFVAALKGTVAMARFMGYIQRANITGFLLTITSIPLIITEPEVGTPLSRSYIIVSAWFALFVWSFFSFLRLAYNFGQIASIKDKAFHGA